jgi:hypothetical protein
MICFSLGRLSLDWMYEVTPRTSLGTSWQPSLLLLYSSFRDFYRPLGINNRVFFFKI